MAEGLETELEASDKTKQDSNNNTSLKATSVCENFVKTSYNNSYNNSNNNNINCVESVERGSENLKKLFYSNQKMLGAIMPCEKICSGFGAIKKEIETSITNTTAASSSTSSSPNLINVKSSNSINNLLNTMSSPRDNSSLAGSCGQSQEQHTISLKDEVGGRHFY